MKKIAYLTLAFLFSNACSQTDKSENNKNMNEITANNIVEKVASQVKHYPNEPLYYIYIYSNICLYEVLVNDYPVVKNYDYGTYATPFYINSAILKSGTQKITLRLHPIGKYQDMFDLPNFTKDTKMEIKVYENDNATGLKIENAKLVKTYTTPTKTMMLGQDKDIKEEWFVAEGKDYYEASFTFDAQVPYEIEGWSKGQDLRKFDQKLLEQKVVEFYKQKSKIYSPPNLDEIAKRKYMSLRDQMIAEYEDRNYIQDAWNEYVMDYNSSYKIQPLLKNYKLEFYGENKLVILLNTSTDVRYRSKTALTAHFIDKDGDESLDFLSFVLYLPEGKKLEDGLEVIR